MGNRGEGEMMLSTDTLLIEIVNVLEDQGIDPEACTVYDYTDPDALTEVVASADSSLEIRITIEGVQLSITQDGVNALS